MEVTQQIADILERAKQRIQSNMESGGVNASGRTSASLQVEKYDNGIRLVSRGTKIAPFRTLEIGREAGKVPQGFTSIIKQWILDKPLAVKQVPYKRQPSDKWQPKYTVEERSLMMAAGSIAHSIAENGTERHSNNRDDIYSNEVRTVINEVRPIISAYIRENIILTTK